jgi:hypothetical protein
VAGLAIIALAYCLWRYLGAEHDGFGRALIVAGIGAGLVSLVQMVVGEVMAYRAAHGSSPDHVQTLFKLLNNLDTVKIVLLAILIAAASVLARRSGAFPHWLAVAGIVFAPLLAISGVAFPQRCALRVTHGHADRPARLGRRGHSGHGPAHGRRVCGTGRSRVVTVPAPRPRRSASPGRKRIRG